MMTPLGSAGGLQERVREVAAEESKERAVGGDVGTTTKNHYNIMCNLYRLVKICLPSCCVVT